MRYRDDRIGYRDQWDFDVQHGICPICGPPYRNGPGPRCTGCNPPVRSYTFACGAQLVTDDPPDGCPACPFDRCQDCAIVKSEILRPPDR
jgi:hypothetical protein